MACALGTVCKEASPTGPSKLRGDASPSPGAALHHTSSGAGEWGPGVSELLTPPGRVPCLYLPGRQAPQIFWEPGSSRSFALRGSLLQ